MGKTLYKRKKRIIQATGVILLFVLGLLAASGFYLQWYGLQAQGNPRGKDVPGAYAYMYETYPHIRSWADSLRRNRALKDTFIRATDGTRLHALYAYATPTTDRTAVIVHGYTDNAVRMLHIGYLYHHDLHYNILLPDLRYSGESEGTHLQMGWNDRKDVIHWMDVANNIFTQGTGYGSTRMVVHGISMGGATTMCVSGEPQEPYVRCFVEDCGYTSVWDEFSGELKNQFGMPEFPLLYTASLLTRARYGWDFKEASPLKQVERCTLPMLFIHGDQDTFVPTWMGDTLYAHKKGKKEYWRVPGVDHAHAYRQFPKIYTQKVKNFTERYIP